jgi:urocanate hydratase
MAENHIDFKYPSYVQDIMGPMCFDFVLALSLGLRFGKPEDLEKQMLLPAPFSKKWQNCTY